MSWEDAVKLLCVSFDSTIQANAGVDLPIDLKVHERDDFVSVRERRFERDDAYYQSVADGWAEALGIALAELPDFHFRSEEHTSELQSLMRISYAVFCLKQKNT